MDWQCRTCMHMINEQNAVSVFAFGNCEEIISDMLMQFAPVMVCDEDYLPKNICTSCLEKLNVGYGFRKLLMASDTQLRRQIAKLQNIDAEDEVDDSEGAVEENLIDFSFPTREEEVNVKFETINEETGFDFESKAELDISIKGDTSFTIEDEMEFVEIKCNQNITDQGHDQEVMLPQLIPAAFEESTNQLVEAEDLAVEETGNVVNTEIGRLKGNEKRKSRSLPNNKLCESAANRDSMETNCFPQPNELSQATEADPQKDSNSDETKRLETKSSQNSPHLRNRSQTSLMEKVLPCSHCDKRFAAEQYLNLHLKVHHKKKSTSEKAFKCTQCDRQFIKKQYLDLHRKVHVTLKTNSNSQQNKTTSNCQYCGEAFLSKYSLEDHVNVLHRDKPLYECSLCDQRFIKSLDLKIHCNAHKKTKLYSCKICSSRFSTTATLKRHTVAHILKQSGRECKICNTSFLYEDPWNSHMIMHKLGLSDQNLLPTQKDPLHCIHCNIIFTEKEVYNTHMNIHWKSFTCGECNRSFFKKKIRNNHMTVHLREEEFPKTMHQCTKCKKIFSKKVSLFNHMHIHENEKERKCLECSKIFRTVWHLTRHARVHNLKKAYECNICGQTFTAMNDFGIHKKIHTYETKQCTHCGLKFPGKKLLKTHMIIHSNP